MSTAEGDPATVRPDMGGSFCLEPAKHGSFILRYKKAIEIG
jgi:hypothetical protein